MRTDSEYLVAYDVADPKRLKKVAKVMAAFGLRVQKSVFECNISAACLKQLLGKLAETIDPVEDTVRVYPLLAGSREKQTILGVGTVVVLGQCLIA